MYDNALSRRTKKQNLIRSKTQSFMLTFQQSHDRVKSVSTMNSLAKSIYSSRQTKKIYSQANMKRSKSFSLINVDNPEISYNPTIKSLNVRASYIPNYSQLNTQLLLQKRKFQQKIYELKQKMKKQTKMLDKSQTECKQTRNNLQKFNNSLKQLEIKSERMNILIDEHKSDCNEYKNNLRCLISENKIKLENLNDQTKKVNNLSNRCKVLKYNLLVEQKNKNVLKSQLIKDQRCMNSYSIRLKELQQEKAVVLLQINQSVTENMLT